MELRNNAENATAGPSKRRAGVTGAGSPIANNEENPSEEEDEDGDDDGDFEPVMVGPGRPTPELSEGPKKTGNGKGKGKQKAGKLSAEEKKAQQVRSTALAGPLQMVRKSKVEKVRKNAEDTIARSRNVDLNDPRIVNNSRAIWEICKRCVTHLEEGQHAPHLRCDRAVVLTHS